MDIKSIIIDVCSSDLRVYLVVIVGDKNGYITQSLIGCNQIGEGKTNCIYGYPNIRISRCDGDLMSRKKLYQLASMGIVVGKDMYHESMNIRQVAGNIPIAYMLAIGDENINDIPVYCRN